MLQFDINNLKKLIVYVIEDHFARLSKLLHELPRSVAYEMFEEKLISRDVRQNPTAEKIINQLVDGFDWIVDKTEVEKYCKRILKVFYNNGGNFERAAEILKTKWSEKAHNDMGVLLKLD